MHHFDSKDNQTFWQGVKGRYQAAFNADLLILLTKPYIGVHILDAGAGDGSLLETLKQKTNNSTIRAIDIAPKHPDIKQGNLTNLPYGNNTFDTIFCSEVIEHITPETTEKVFKEFQRVLKPSGHLIVTTPFDEDLSLNMITCPGCELRFHRWGHQQSFTENDFATLATQHTFTPKHIFPIKFSRIRRFKFLGRLFLSSQWWINRMRRAKGKKNLIMVAQNKK